MTGPASLSQSLINRSLDLLRLRDEGYDLSVRHGYLVLDQVPYVNSAKRVMRGTLVSELTAAGNQTAQPSTHVVMFQGDMPCDAQGDTLSSIEHSNSRKQLGDDLLVTHSFSSKPAGGYRDYYEKLTAYSNILTTYAAQLDSDVTARVFPVHTNNESDSVFLYDDTASSRAGIRPISNRLQCGSVAIVGLGGTGAYILDLLAKTPVQHIHLFDGDTFLQHNAFRAPGAASITHLERREPKSHYFASTYSSMRRNIHPHGYVDESTISRLQDMEFVFLAVDSGQVRSFIMDHLILNRVPFIDVGMGILEVDGTLTGQLRTATVTEASRDFVVPKIPRVSTDDDGDYSSNIQIAELNSLNAALAVIKWKKLMGFYADPEKEHFSVYQVDGNSLINENRVQ